MNVVEKPVNTVDNRPDNRPKVAPLAPPMRLETGAIVTLLMRGHSRSPGGLEYYAPAVVLNQYADDVGSLEVLVWDSSAGTHYNPSYPTRELSTRGDGGERETYESKSNIGEVLFSPEKFALMLQSMEQFDSELQALAREVYSLRGVVNGLKSLNAPALMVDAAKATPPDTKNAKRSE